MSTLFFFMEKVVNISFHFAVSKHHHTRKKNLIHGTLTFPPLPRPRRERKAKKMEEKFGRRSGETLRKMRLSHVVVLAALLSGSECTSGPTHSVPTLRRGLKTDSRSVVAQFRETEVNSRAVANTLCAYAKMGRKPRPYLGSYCPLEMRSLRGGRCVHADSEEQ